ncbi:SapC family protein [Microvirga sp. W0021]|uniref:SapC family protein n=1 Tax=Hohaiivirga grylli TaxID=3133970 RepID=A0ABV0BI81_9HYPH
MSTIMLLYKEAVGLSRETHAKKKLKTENDFSFAAGVHWMPVAGAEFYAAARNYPIVFVEENKEFRPILLLGLEVGHNEFVDKDNHWKANTYLPAFVRRYPFVLAETDGKNNEFAVAIDPTYSGWSETEGRELFNEDGTNSPFLDEMMQFMNSFTAEMQRTAEFVKELDRLKLLIKKSADIRSADGQLFQVQDLYMVDEEAFSKISGDELEKLNKSGQLGWVFAHLMSLANLPNLFDLHKARKSAENS